MPPAFSVFADLIELQLTPEEKLFGTYQRASDLSFRRCEKSGPSGPVEMSAIVLGDSLIENNWQKRSIWLTAYTQRKATLLTTTAINVNVSAQLTSTSPA